MWVLDSERWGSVPVMYWLPGGLESSPHPPAVISSGFLLCVWQNHDSFHVPLKRWNFPYVEHMIKIDAFPNPGPKDKWSWVRMLQSVDGSGACSLPLVLNFVVKDFESWQISQGFVKSINYKLWNLGRWKFIMVHLANMIKVFSVLIWCCLTTVCKE